MREAAPERGVDLGRAAADAAGRIEMGEEESAVSGKSVLRSECLGRWGRKGRFALHGKFN